MKFNPLFFLLVFVPVSILLEILHANEIWIFASSAAAIIPLAALMGKATKHLSEKLGAGLGGLLNASFGRGPTARCIYNPWNSVFLFTLIAIGGINHE